MREIFLLVYLMLFFIAAGCSYVSEEKAEKLIVEEYSNHLGKAVIISTIEIDNEYYIEWERMLFFAHLLSSLKMTF